MSQQSNQAPASVTFFGPEIDIKDKVEAKKADDYIHNEEPEEREPQSLEEALLGDPSY